MRKLSFFDRWRLPTERQLDFIAELLEEREVQRGVFRRPPRSLKEASELITRLLDQPHNANSSRRERDVLYEEEIE